MSFWVLWATSICVQVGRRDLNAIGGTAASGKEQRHGRLVGNSLHECANRSKLQHGNSGGRAASEELDGGNPLQTTVLKKTAGRRGLVPSHRKLRRRHEQTCGHQIPVLAAPILLFKNLRPCSGPSISNRGGTVQHDGTKKELTTNSCKNGHRNVAEHCGSAACSQRKVESDVKAWAECKHVHVCERKVLWLTPKISPGC